MPFEAALFFRVRLPITWVKGRKVVAAGYLCPTCQKNVYLADGDEHLECPVCSSPLVGGTEDVAAIRVVKRIREYARIDKVLFRSAYYLG